MIAELGHYALILALVVALVQGTLPLIGAQRRTPAWIAVARPAAILQAGLIGIAFLALTHAFVTSDFSVVNVAENSHSAKPMLYKISGVWGNHEGSMVLWVLILALYGLAVALFGRNLPPSLRARVLAVQALIAVGFLLFIILTSNPFERLSPAPLDGRGLNPLLQDPGLAFHPPMLYFGYVGFSMAFAFAIAALIEGRVDAAWARWVRPWTLAAWCFLTAGIALGSWWAYYELGWGGWWFWDPVENASFMPWLAGTALLHSAIVCEKRDTLKSWTILLAILTFSLSLLGTFLVRSGVLTSVHAFATDPERGVFILAFLVLVTGGALALFAVRAPGLAGGGLFAPISREGALVLNNLLLTVGCATVFLGTLYPLFLEIAGGGKVSVGGPYFNATFIPLMVPLVAFVPVGSMLPWKRGDLAGVLARLRFAGGVAGATALAVLALVEGTSLLAAGGVLLAAWLAAGVLTELAGRVQLLRVDAAESWRRLVRLPRASVGMSLAHLGVAVFVAGVTGSVAWHTEKVQTMRVGETVEVAGYQFTLDGVSEHRGPNYTATSGQFTVTRQGAPVTRLRPEKRIYPAENMPTTEAAIHSTAMRDLYAVLGDPAEDGAWTTRLYVNPLIAWIWFGCFMMVGGGLLSLSDRRHRVGAPVRQAVRAGVLGPAKA
ncbi:MAG: heme lyase CcmF/NrfE family subunit [Alphaproteobacteria bacterium]|nr:heme lyase CcmF/NrfE family subunit [Alphaproteobacteria bacterium]